MQLVKGLFISLIVLSFASIEAKPKRADYVVVGIGTAGAVMAKELSDKYTVIGLHEGANLTNDPLIKYTAGALIMGPAGLFAPVPFLYDGGNMVPQISCRQSNAGLGRSEAARRRLVNQCRSVLQRDDTRLFTVGRDCRADLVAE